MTSTPSFRFETGAPPPLCGCFRWMRWAWFFAPSPPRPSSAAAAPTLFLPSTRISPEHVQRIPPGPCRNRIRGENPERKLAERWERPGFATLAEIKAQPESSLAIIGRTGRCHRGRIQRITTPCTTIFSLEEIRQAFQPGDTDAVAAFAAAQISGLPPGGWAWLETRPISTNHGRLLASLRLSVSLRRQLGISPGCSVWSAFSACLLLLAAWWQASRVVDPSFSSAPAEVPGWPERSMAFKRGILVQRCPGEPLAACWGAMPSRSWSRCRSHCDGPQPAGLPVLDPAGLIPATCRHRPSSRC